MKPIAYNAAYNALELGCRDYGRYMDAELQSHLALAAVVCAKIEAGPGNWVDDLGYERAVEAMADVIPYCVSKAQVQARARKACLKFRTVAGKEAV